MKQQFIKLSPHTCNDCPCALLIVIANASRTGNCKRLNSNGVSVGIMGMRGAFRLKLSPQLYLYPPHRGYISFVNTCGTPRNIDLRP